MVRSSLGCEGGAWLSPLAKVSGFVPASQEQPLASIAQAAPGASAGGPSRTSTSSQAGPVLASTAAKKFAENQPKKDTPKKEKPAKEDKKQQAPQQQEKKEDKKPAPEDELDECEQALAAEPKTKDPFAHLPKRWGWTPWGEGGGVDQCTRGVSPSTPPMCLPGLAGGSWVSVPFPPSLLASSGLPATCFVHASGWGCSQAALRAWMEQGRAALSGQTGGKGGHGPAPPYQREGT